MSFKKIKVKIQNLTESVKDFESANVESIKQKATSIIDKVDTKKLEQNYKKGQKAFIDFQKTAADKVFESQSLLDNISLKAGNISQGITSTATSFAGLAGSFLADNDLLRHLETLTKSTATVYDKALDSEYLKTNIGGGNHRMFDGGHDIFSAWEKAKDALPDDKFTEEVIGYTSALWKDVTTVKGLPFATVAKDSFDSWAETISGIIPGLDKKYLYDLLSFDAYELLSSSLGAVSIVFALKHEDQEKLAEILGSMGIVSILSANPIMGILVIGTSAFAYSKKKMDFDKKSFTKSAIITTTSMTLFSVLGFPILFELVIVGVLTKTLRKQVLDNDELLEDMKEKIQNKYEEIKNLHLKPMS